MPPEPQQIDRPFSITQGGPFYHLLRWLHLMGPNGPARAWIVAAAIWIPLALSILLHAAFTGAFEPIASDISMHARVLISIPVVLASERLVNPAVHAAVRELYSSEPPNRPAIDHSLGRAERLRDNAWIEGGFAVLAIIGGQLVLWGVFGPTGVVYGKEHVASWTFTRVWYALIAVPLTQFLLLRWLWRWAIWTYVLVRFSRLPLTLLATHPDRAAGLAGLNWPVAGFAVFALADSSTLSAAWATQLLAHRATVPELLPTFAVFLVGAVVVSCGPLLLFTGQLYRARLQTLAHYSAFARDYVRQFDRKWIEDGDYDRLLGTDDIQALNDLGGSFVVIDETRIVVVGAQQLAYVALGVIVPMLPLLAASASVTELVKKLGRTLLGGLPI